VDPDEYPRVGPWIVDQSEKEEEDNAPINLTMDSDPPLPVPPPRGGTLQPATIMVTEESVPQLSNSVDISAIVSAVLAASRTETRSARERSSTPSGSPPSYGEVEE